MHPVKPPSGSLLPYGEGMVLLSALASHSTATQRNIRRPVTGWRLKRAFEKEHKPNSRQKSAATSKSGQERRLCGHALPALELVRSCPEKSSHA
jgi:hypothetical protein